MTTWTPRQEFARSIRRLMWIMQHVEYLDDIDREWLIDKLIADVPNMQTANYWIQRRR